MAVATGKIGADGAGVAPTGCCVSPCAIKASISASNCDSRVFASLSESLAMVFQSGIGHVQGNKVQDVCPFKFYSERRKDERFTEALLHRNNLLHGDDGVAAGF